MNEWKQFLHQTHPNFQTLMSMNTTEESHLEELHALEKSEIEWVSPVDDLNSKIANIPDKLAFKIGEAADYVGVKQYVLRYWESEFDALKPKKSGNGQRMYTRKDIETALFIKKLLHEDRFSIEGAITALKRLRKQMKDKSTPSKEIDIDGDSLGTAESILESIRQARFNLSL